jgi:EmrB/QacA subfamily drug resistance transporter
VAIAVTVVAAESVERERRWWVLAAMCLSLVTISLSNTSLNVALPTLERDLHASSAGLQWIVDAYSLVFAGCLLTAGAAGDRFGRRAALNVGLVIFGLASALATLSSSAGQLIAARGVMGVGAAFIMPATLSVIAHVFPPDERSRAVAIWAGFAGAGGAAGSVLSGWLLQHFWWGSIFLSNVAAVVVALIVGAVLVPSSKDESAPRLDPVGAMLSIVGLAVLLYAIIEAPGNGWLSRETGVGLAAAAVTLALFVLWEQTVAEPMLDLGLFRDRTFTGAASTITVIFFVMYGTVFVVTQVLQVALGYTPLEAGLRILPLPLAFMASAPQSARLVRRWGLRPVVCCGLGLLAVGTGLLSLSATSGTYPVLAAGLLVAAIGMGLTTAPSTGAIMFSVPLGKAGVASAVNDTTRELGGSLGVAALGSVLTSSYHAQADMRVAAATSADLTSPASFAHAAHVALLVACGIAVLSMLVMFRLLGRTGLPVIEAA